MTTVNQTLLFLHFLGLAMGFSVSLANMTMSGLIARAAPPEKAVLGRFPPLMSRFGTIGLAILWITGVILVYTRWGGFSTLPWEFYVKVGAVVLLTVTTATIHRWERRLGDGELSALPRIETLGKIATVLALVALVFAVLTFD